MCHYPHIPNLKHIIFVACPFCRMVIWPSPSVLSRTSGISHFLIKLGQERKFCFQKVTWTANIFLLDTTCIYWFKKNHMSITFNPFVIFHTDMSYYIEIYTKSMTFRLILYTVSDGDSDKIFSEKNNVILPLLCI